MKIIKKGKLNPKVYRGSCNRCNCVIEETADRLQIKTDPRNDSYAELNCPMEFCGNTIILMLWS